MRQKSKGDRKGERKRMGKGKAGKKGEETKLKA